MKKILIIISIVLVAGIAFHFLSGTQQSEPTRYMDIESYVKSDISSLSPTKESLGGTFYVTSIMIRGNQGTVSYEDGHNAYTADFSFEIDKKGKPAVTGFKIR